MTRVLVCGDRNWNDPEPIRQVLNKYGEEDTPIHGGCRGADSLAGIIGFERKMKVIVFQADWKRYGRAAVAPVTRLRRLGRRELTLW